MSMYIKQNSDGTFALVNALTGSTILTINADDSIDWTGAGLMGMSRGTLAAAGTGASDAGVITKQVTAVTASDGTKGVALPTAATTTGPLLVINTVATAALKVYPVNGGNDNINGLAEDAAWTLGPGQAVWFIPTSATQWYAGEGPAVKAKELTGTYTVLASENGMTYYLNSATEFVTTLPSPFLGADYTFIVKAAPSGASYTVVTGSSANIIKGVQLTAQDAGGSGDSGTADDTISFVDGQAVAGDMVRVTSDGTSWFAYAFSKVLAGITFTQAST